MFEYAGVGACRTGLSPLFRVLFLTIVLAWISACQIDEPLLPARVIVAEFDPASGIIPTPNDLLTDRDTGLIAIPSEPEDLEGKSPVEIDLIAQLNQRRAWSTRTEAKLTFSGPLDPTSITSTGLKVYQIAETGLTEITPTLRGEPADAPTQVVIEPPETGWQRGAQYVVVALGSDGQLQGKLGEPVVSDAAFWYLRLNESLLEHTKAMPGETEEERLEAAEKLEQVRQDLAPHFTELESRGINRGNIAQLWSFSITSAPELFMDKAAGKMPIPSDFLRNPATGLVDLPIRESYSDFKTQSVGAINELDGFGLSTHMIFELTAPIQPTTVSSESVKLFEMSEDGELRELAIEFTVRPNNQFIKVGLQNGILAHDTYHLLVITDAMKNAQGESVEAMLPGMLAMAGAPIFEAGASTLSSLDAETANKLELVRHKTAPGVAQLSGTEALGTSKIAAAWSFKTQDIKTPMMRIRDLAARANINPNPTVSETKSVMDILLEFPVGIVSMFHVDKVINGTIEVPNTLDHTIRERFGDGTWNIESLPFTMTIPSGVSPDEPLKTVIFGHPLVTERRMLYAVADAMAREGYATIGIDFPYHGERTHCSYFGPMCVPSILNSEEMWCPEPCQSGAWCTEDGRCVDNAGEGNHLSTWPVLPMYQASGATFLELDNLPGTRDHFYQGISDLSALLRSLKEGDWKSAMGFEIAPEVGYAGQSLGGIMGTVFTATQPSIHRSVLNVPGGDLVSLFRDSGWFQSHFNKFVDDHHLERGGSEFDLMLLIAGWMLDAIDPQSYTPYLIEKNFDTEEPLDRDVIIQMATFDTVIPNANTEVLSELSGVPMYSYPASHAFLVVPVEPSYLPGMNDLSKLITQGVYQ